MIWIISIEAWNLAYVDLDLHKLILVCEHDDSQNAKFFDECSWFLNEGDGLSFHVQRIPPIAFYA